MVPRQTHFPLKDNLKIRPPNELLIVSLYFVFYFNLAIILISFLSSPNLIILEYQSGWRRIATLKERPSFSRLQTPYSFS